MNITISLQQIEKVLAVLFFLAVPLQVRYFLFGPVSPEQAEQGAEFVEWLSGFVYVSDVIFAALFVVWLVRYGSLLRTTLRRRFVQMVAVSVLISFFPLFWALNGDAALFRSIKYVEFFLVFVWAYSTRTHLTIAASCLAFSGVFQALVGIGQFLTQKSLGLVFLAESPLARFDENVAEIITTTGRFIRAYGTVPSPNILAFFLVITLLLLIFLYCKKHIPLAVFVLCSWVVSFALALTFSRGAISVGILAGVAFILLLVWRVKDVEKRAVQNAAIVLLCCCISVGGLLYRELYERFFVAVHYDNAVSDRIDSYGVVDSFHEYLLYGAGGGNTVAVGSVSQPIHNVFVLSAFEWGIVCSLILIFVIGCALLRQLPVVSVRNTLFFCGVASVIAVSCIDHFFLTTQQGGLLLWVLMGFALRDP